MNYHNHYWVYILLCQNNTYYTGYTTDLAKRYQSHLNGSGKCKYTRSFKPQRIAQCWQVIGTKSLAMKIERQIKRLSRLEKEKLIVRPSKLSDNNQVKTVTKRCRIQLQQYHCKTNHQYFT